MKKLLGIFLTLVLLLSVCGCAQEPNDLEDPVTFYYCRDTDQITYGAPDSVIAGELREGYGHRDDPAYLIGLYLKGPVGDGLNRTFPKGVELIEFSLADGTAAITVSDFFSTLTGLDLTLACACLTKTVCELTGAAQVTVSAETTLLDGNRSVTMTPGDVLTLDECDIVIDPN